MSGRAGVRVAPCIDDHWHDGHRAPRDDPKVAFHSRERGEDIRRHGLPRLDLDSHESTALLDHHVAFVPLLIAEKGQPWRQTAMCVPLDDLGDGPAFENCAPQRVGVELRRRTDAQGPAQEPRVVEVELRRLDDPPGEIAVQRRQPEGDEARLENRQPGAGGRVRDAGVCPERREVHELPHTTGAQAQDTAKGAICKLYIQLTPVVSLGNQEGGSFRAGRAVTAARVEFAIVSMLAQSFVEYGALTSLVSEVQLFVYRSAAGSAWRDRRPGWR